MASDLLIFAGWEQLAFTCGVLVVAEAVYVLLGFGAGMIAVGALALVLPDVRDVVVLLLLVNLPPELAVVRGSWDRIQRRGIALVLVGIAVGVPTGTWLLRWGEPTLLLDLLGAFLVVVGLVFLLLPVHAAVRWPRWAAPAAGLASGALAGLFGTGGPPLVVYYQLAGGDRTRFRGNLMAIFLAVTLIRLPAYGLAGLITLPRLLSAAAVLPAVLAGALLGHRIHLSLDDAAFRRVVAAALAAVGALLLLRLRM